MRNKIKNEIDICINSDCVMAKGCDNCQNERVERIMDGFRELVKSMRKHNAYSKRYNKCVDDLLSELK